MGVGWGDLVIPFHPDNSPCLHLRAEGWLGGSVHSFAQQTLSTHFQPSPCWLQGMFGWIRDTPCSLGASPRDRWGQGDTYRNSNEDSARGLNKGRGDIKLSCEDGLPRRGRRHPRHRAQSVWRPDEQGCLRRSGPVGLSIDDTGRAQAC